MDKVKKPVFFIVFIVIALFSVTVYFGIDYWYGDFRTVYIKGVKDIRLGIDIQGGVDVTFTPEDDYDASESELDAALEVIKLRLSSSNITDSETYIDKKNDRIIVRFPWQVGETEFNPEQAVNELGDVAMMYFMEGTEYDMSKVVFAGEHIDKAYVSIDNNQKYVVALELDSEATSAFSDATGRLAASNGYISIWMDDVCISSPTVGTQITDGKAIISSQSYENDYNEAKALADKINSGSLPFKLVTSSFKTISPTMGSGALNAMIISGFIAFAFIAIYMISLYRLPGVVAVIALAGQVAGILAGVSGYFGFRASSTLTIPGIAGIILSIGMGVDANIISCERIKEELLSGKTLDASIKSGYDRASTSIFDGNLTVIIVAIVLMGAFGVPTGIFAKMLRWAFFMFGTSTEGTIYSFGYTLLAGIIMNFIMGVLATKLMVFSLSKFKIFRNKKLYGGVNND